MVETKLEPCPNPWCESSAPEMLGYGVSHYGVACGGCQLAGPRTRDREDAIAAWNTRAPLPTGEDKSEPSEAVVERAAYELRERSRFPSGQPRISPEKAAENARAALAAPDGDGLLEAIADEDSMSEVQVSARLTAQTRIWHAMKDLGYTPTPEGVKAIRAAAFGGLRDAAQERKG